MAKSSKERQADYRKRSAARNAPRDESRNAEPVTIPTVTESAPERNAGGERNAGLVLPSDYASRLARIERELGIGPWTLVDSPQRQQAERLARGEALVYAPDDPSGIEAWRAWRGRTGPMREGEHGN